MSFIDGNFQFEKRGGGGFLNQEVFTIAVNLRIFLPDSSAQQDGVLFQRITSLQVFNTLPLLYAFFVL